VCACSVVDGDAFLVRRLQELHRAGQGPGLGLIDPGGPAIVPYLAWLGQRWFLLPNPTYGNWYSAPYGDQEKLPFERKRQLKQQALQLEN
jgi:hypothetical protein